MIITTVRQYSVFLPNKPGALSEFTKLFADQGIAIIGIASEIRDDSGVVRVSVESDKRIGYILTQAGFTTVETSMLSLELPDNIGELHRLSSKLGEAGVNITTVYGTTHTGRTSRLLFSVNDLEKAKEVLNNLYNK